MSSIEPGDAEIYRLFDGGLCPLAEEMRARGAAPFPSRPDPSLASYYLARPQVAMTREDFEAPSCADFDDFERRLAAHWGARGRAELAALAPEVAAAARAVYALTEQDAEVSPFVYVMF